MNERPFKMIAFGDLLLRLNPPGAQRFVQASEFEVRFTGAEANTAVMLSNFGVRTYAVSRVPDNEIGSACLGYLRRFGIDTDHVARGGDRLGVTNVADEGQRVAAQGLHFRGRVVDRARELLPVYVLSD